MKRNLVRFIEATPKHLEIIYKWRNDPLIRRVMYNSNLLKWEDHVKWFQMLQTDEEKVLRILYYDGIPYGVANFRVLNKESGVGEWGFYIGEKNAPKGMGKALAYMMLNFLFDNMKIHKVCAEVLDYNTISLNFHEKIGFEKEGVLRKHILKDGRYCDIHLFSILKNEWVNQKLILEKELFD